MKRVGLSVVLLVAGFVGGMVVTGWVRAAKVSGFARGEIDEQEYRSRMAELRGDPQAAGGGERR